MPARKKSKSAICDINLPGMNGFQVMETLQKEDPETEVIMITGFGTIERAVEAMKKGAYDFVQKPFQLAELLTLVEKSLEKGHLRNLVKELRQAKRQLEITQQRLIQTEKMASLGKMAAGVAHELNNPLSGVFGFTQLLLQDPTLSEQQRQDLETIEAQTRRCRAIIQGMLQFSRRQETHQKALNLPSLLQSTIQLMTHELTLQGIDVQEKYPLALPIIQADATQLQQVLINLISNARDALEGRPAPRITITAGEKEGWVFVSIQDNGCGISEKMQNKIFDPFFTTKPPGKGTGLGLAICHGIIEAHQGRVHVESQLHAGTTFTLEFPVQKTASLH